MSLLVKPPFKIIQKESKLTAYYIYMMALGAQLKEIRSVLGPQVNNSKLQAAYMMIRKLANWVPPKEYIIKVTPKTKEWTPFLK